MQENRLHEHASYIPPVDQTVRRPTVFFPVRSSFLPDLQLGPVALESLLVQIEDAVIARALATIVLARPDRRNRRRVVVSGKLGHIREQGDASGQAKEPQRTRYFSENGERFCCSTAMFFWPSCRGAYLPEG